MFLDAQIDLEYWRTNKPAPDIVPVLVIRTCDEIEIHVRVSDEAMDALKRAFVTIPAGVLVPDQHLL